MVRPFNRDQSEEVVHLLDNDSHRLYLPLVLERRSSEFGRDLEHDPPDRLIGADPVQGFVRLGEVQHF